VKFWINSPSIDANAASQSTLVSMGFWLLCSVGLHIVVLATPGVAGRHPAELTSSEPANAFFLGNLQKEMSGLQVWLTAPPTEISVIPALRDSDSNMPGESRNNALAEVVDLPNLSPKAAPKPQGSPLPDRAPIVNPLNPEARYYRPNELDRKPEITKQVEPDFPLEVNPGTKGTVIVRLFIGADGALEHMNIVSSSPEGIFDKSVMKAFAGAKFSPGARGRKAVRTVLTLAVDFQSEIPR
jgi:TonB family protein